MAAWTCAICGTVPERGSLVLRPLVPRGYLKRGVFEIDPLGTADAEVPLCEACAATVESPMLLAEDVARFAQALGLHRQQHAPAPGREDEAARARLWHRALHLGIRALLTELMERPVASQPRAEPDQLGLFASRTARFARVESALAEGELARAVELASELARRFDAAEARYLVSRLPEIADRVLACVGDPDAIAALAEHPRQLLDAEIVPTALVTALGRGLHRLTAEAAEARDLAAVIGGRPVGWHWLEAGEPARARASLERSVSDGKGRGYALVLLGNLAGASGQTSAAREWYRRAFVLSPSEAPVDLIADPAVAELIDEVHELELEPAPNWVPLVGYLHGVFGLAPTPEGEGDSRAFHEALLEARRTRDLAARRRMKALSPRLFEEIREAGKL